MLGNLDDLFSGKKLWVLNDDEEDSGDNVDPEEEKTTEVKIKGKESGLKVKCKKEILRAKGNQKKKDKVIKEICKSDEIKLKRLKQKEVKDIAEKKISATDNISKKMANVNISEKLKSISSKVRQIDDNKTKIGKLSSIRDEKVSCANKITKAYIKPLKVKKTNLVSESKQTKDNVNSVKKDSSSGEKPEKVSSAEKTTNKNKNINLSAVNKGNKAKRKLKNGPAQAINKIVGSKKPGYADNLNKMLVGLRDGNLRKEYNEKDKRVMVRKVKKYLKAQARNQKKADKKLKKNIKKDDPTTALKNRKRKRKSK